MKTYYMHTHNGGGIGMTAGPCRTDDDCQPRPRLVIDSTDRSEVEELAAAYVKADGRGAPWELRSDGSRRTVVDALQAALRSLITPPRPEEPMGFASAVEDAEGVWWVRTGTGPRCGDWINPDGEIVDYDDITAVKILSDGVA